MLDRKGLVCLNDRRATGIDVAQGGYSSIDLTLVSESLGCCMWDVWEDSTIGSDHFLIYYKTGLDVNEIVEEK